MLLRCRLPHLTSPQLTSPHHKQNAPRPDWDPLQWSGPDNCPQSSPAHRPPARVHQQISLHLSSLTRPGHHTPIVGQAKLIVDKDKSSSTSLISPFLPRRDDSQPEKTAQFHWSWLWPNCCIYHYQPENLFVCSSLDLLIKFRLIYTRTSATLIMLYFPSSGGGGGPQNSHSDQMFV